MSWQAWLQVVVLVGLVLASAPPLGAYVARVFSGGPAPGDRLFAPVERAVYRVAGVDPEREQPWTVYAISLIAFSAVSVLGLFLLLRFRSLCLVSLLLLLLWFLLLL